VAATRKSGLLLGVLLSQSNLTKWALHLMCSVFLEQEMWRQSEGADLLA